MDGWVAAWPAIDTIPCRKHILLIPSCVKPSNLEFVGGGCVHFSGSGRCAFASYEYIQCKLLLKAELGMGLHKAVVSSVTELGNLVHDRASREKFDFTLILGQFLGIPVHNISCGTCQLCDSLKVSGTWVIYLVSTPLEPGRYFLPELEWDTGRMITQHQLLMCLISIRYLCTFFH